jgi:hypothetical protein
MSRRDDVISRRPIVGGFELLIQEVVAAVRTEYPDAPRSEQERVVLQGLARMAARGRS